MWSHDDEFPAGVRWAASTTSPGSSTSARRPGARRRRRAWTSSISMLLRSLKGMPLQFAHATQNHRHFRLPTGSSPAWGQCELEAVVAAIAETEARGVIPLLSVVICRVDRADISNDGSER